SIVQPERRHAQNRGDGANHENHAGQANAEILYVRRRQPAKRINSHEDGKKKGRITPQLIKDVGTIGAHYPDKIAWPGREMRILTEIERDVVWVKRHQAQSYENTDREHQEPDELVQAAMPGRNQISSPIHGGTILADSRPESEQHHN